MSMSMPDRLAHLAARLDEEVFQRIELSTPAAFLVGAARSAASALRAQIREELAGKPRITGFDVYYPEDLFEELLRGGEKGADLLELENLLAENVHAIVIVLESEGAIAEFGAFANHERLRDRLIVVVNSKYRRARSFIMLGPVSYLRRKTTSKIIYHDFKRPDLRKLGEDVRGAVRKVSKGVVVDTSVRNPVAAQHYLRAAVHVLHPVSQAGLQSLIQRAAGGTPEQANRIVSTSLSILYREGEVALSAEGYSLTEAGRHRLGRMLQLERQGRAMTRSLDRARIDVLTWRLRHPQKLTA